MLFLSEPDSASSLQDISLPNINASDLQSLVYTSEITGSKALSRYAVKVGRGLDDGPQESRGCFNSNPLAIRLFSSQQNLI